MLSRQLLRLTAVARILVLLAMGAPILWAHDGPALFAMIGVASLWFFAQVASTVSYVSAWVDPTVEATAIGILCGLAMHSSMAILAALALAPFVAGLRRGLTGVGLATSAQLIAVVLVSLARFGSISVDESSGAFTWSIAGLGLGLIGTFVRATVLEGRHELVPYREAQSLIRELIDISGGLQSGLDVASLAGLVASTVRDRLPTVALAIYVPRGPELVSLVSETEDEDGLLGAEMLAMDAWVRSETLVRGLTFAFPLGESTVMAGSCSAAAGLSRDQVELTVAELRRDLRVSAVQLDTALLFSDFRDSASADVRRRLAREMHDGIAQDLASLGYLVDALAARPATAQQALQFTMLRDQITAIVAEVRQSVLTLRTSIGESASLGAAISAVARHLSESSQIPIHVTLDEHSTRLRPEVEAELFRIAQEAMNNAIKHARCSAIEVSCHVYAPDALIIVTDDGRGMQPSRSDSFGLKIMRERARLVNADLTIGDNPAGGLVVAAQISSTGKFPPFTPPSNADRVNT